MLYGMTYEQYWYGDPNMAGSFRKLHELKIEQKNQELWLQGLYIYNAVGVVASNALSKKGSSSQKYLEKPIDILPKSKEQQEKEAEDTRQKVIDALSAWKKQWDAQKGGK